MQIGVIGATGTIGSRVVSEALSRGHRVTAFSRDASLIEDGRENLTWQSLDVLDAAAIAQILPGLDVLISAFGPGRPSPGSAPAVSVSATTISRSWTPTDTAASPPRTRPSQ